MSTVHLHLDDDLVTLLGEAGPTVEQAARELMVLELYRRAAISSGKAAALLELDRFDFIRYASGLGIPFFDMTEEEWAAEMRAVEEIVQSRSSSPTPAR